MHPARTLSAAAALSAVLLVSALGSASAGVVGLPTDAQGPQADGFQVRVGMGDDRVRVGGDVAYTIRVSNTGPADFADAEIVQLLPPDLNDPAASAGGAVDPLQITWRRGIEAGTEATVASSGTVGAPDEGFDKLTTVVCVRPTPESGLVGCSSASAPISAGVPLVWLAAAGCVLAAALAGVIWLVRTRRRTAGAPAVSATAGAPGLVQWTTSPSCPPLGIALESMPWRFRLWHLHAVDLPAPAADPAEDPGEQTTEHEALSPEAEQKQETEKEKDPVAVFVAVESAEEPAADQAAGQAAGQAADQAAEKDAVKAPPAVSVAVELMDEPPAEGDAVNAPVASEACEPMEELHSDEDAEKAPPAVPVAVESAEEPDAEKASSASTADVEPTEEPAAESAAASESEKPEADEREAVEPDRADTDAGNEPAADSSRRPGFGRRKSGKGGGRWRKRRKAAVPEPEADGASAAEGAAPEGGAESETPEPERDFAAAERE